MKKKNLFVSIFVLLLAFSFVSCNGVFGQKEPEFTDLTYEVPQELINSMSRLGYDFYKIEVKLIEDANSRWVRTGEGSFDIDSKSASTLIIKDVPIDSSFTASVFIKACYEDDENKNNFEPYAEGISRNNKIERGDRSCNINVKMSLSYDTEYIIVNKFQDYDSVENLTDLYEYPSEPTVFEGEVKDWCLSPFGGIECFDSEDDPEDKSFCSIFQSLHGIEYEVYKDISSGKYSVWKNGESLFTFDDVLPSAGEELKFNDFAVKENSSGDTKDIYAVFGRCFEGDFCSGYSLWLYKNNSQTKNLKNDSFLFGMLNKRKCCVKDMIYQAGHLYLLIGDFEDDDCNIYDTGILAEIDPDTLECTKCTYLPSYRSETLLECNYLEVIDSYAGGYKNEWIGITKEELEDYFNERDLTPQIEQKTLTMTKKVYDLDEAVMLNPVKFISMKPKKLVFSSTGRRVSNDTKDGQQVWFYDKINRVCTFDLETFSLESSVNIVPEEGTYFEFDDNGEFNVYELLPDYNEPPHYQVLIDSESKIVESLRNFIVLQPRNYYF